MKPESLSLPTGRWTGWVTWIIRILTGAVFLYSGFVKAVDPWGTLYKFDDYLAAMGLEIWPNLVLCGVFMLCALEFLLGAFLVLGCFRRATPICTLAFMCVMLPLTLWIAMSDPVADCGCFGDALVISNWATFWKNVVLGAFTLWLVAYNRKSGWIVTPALQWIAFVITGIFIVCIELLGYNYQPLIDFRPYADGTTLFESESDVEEHSDGATFVFTYEKNGVKRDFSEDDELPDEADGWNFVERKEISSPETSKSIKTGKDDKNFRIWDEHGDEDITSDIADDGMARKLFIFMPDLTKVSIASSYKINSLNSWAEKNGIEMMAVVAGDEGEISRWKDLSMAEYPLYTADDTAIKEVVRGNPAVVYVADDTIRWKSTLKTIEIDDFLAPGTSSDPMSFSRDNQMILRNLIMIFLAMTTVLIACSFLPKLGKIYGNKKKINVKDAELK